MYFYHKKWNPLESEHVFGRSPAPVASLLKIFGVSGPEHEFVARFKNREDISKEKIVLAQNVRNAPEPAEAVLLEIDP